jgi:hypothetical protein
MSSTKTRKGQNKDETESDLKLDTRLQGEKGKIYEGIDMIIKKCFMVVTEHGYVIVETVAAAFGGEVS